MDYYDLEALCSANVLNIDRKDDKILGKIGEIMLGHFFQEDGQLKFKELFTSIIISSVSNVQDKTSMMYFTSMNLINEYLTDKELLEKKVSKERLIQIYHLLNHHKMIDKNIKNEDKVIMLDTRRNRK